MPCGEDNFAIKQTKGDISLTSGAGLFSKTNITIQDTDGGIDIDLGSAKLHTLSLSNTRGNVHIDTGFKVEQSDIRIEETTGDVDLYVGGGKMHTIYLMHTTGAASLNYDLGDKTIAAFNTTGSFEAKLTDGNDMISVDKTEGSVTIESGDGLHEYALNQTSGIVGIKVGEAGWTRHVFNLTDTAGSVSITAGEGDCVINGLGMTGPFTGVLGDGDDDIVLINAAVDFHFTSGLGKRKIVADSLRSFTALLGSGDDEVNLRDTQGSVSFRSGDGLHKASFDNTVGNIEIDVGRAVGRGRSQLFTIKGTSGNITLNAGDGNHDIDIDDTSDGRVLLKAGQSYGLGLFDIRGTTGQVDIVAKGGTSNNVMIANTASGVGLHGNVSIVIGTGPCTLDVVNALGDVYVDLQGEVNMLGIANPITAHILCFLTCHDRFRSRHNQFV